MIIQIKEYLLNRDKKQAFSDLLSTIKELPNDEAITLLMEFADEVERLTLELGPSKSEWNWADP
jgi:hypothetical protein